MHLKNLSSYCSGKIGLTNKKKAWNYCFLLIFTATFFVSGIYRSAGSIIDGSWQVALEYALLAKMQFGKEVIFTYGPLGTLNCSASQGYLVGIRAIFAVFWASMLAWAATDLIFAISGRCRFLFLFWLLAYTCRDELDFHVYLVMAFCCWLLLREQRTNSFSNGLALFTLALLSAIKFTFFFASLASITLYNLNSIIRGCKWKDSTLITAGFGGFFLLVWFLCGQSIANIGSFFINGLEITSGYSDAMALPIQPRLFMVCLVAGFLFICLSLLLLWHNRKSVAEPVYILIIMFYAFLLWKHGLVRADQHVIYFVLSLPLLAGALLRVAAGDKGQPDGLGCRCATTLFLAVLFFCLTAATITRKDSWQDFTKLPLTILDNVSKMEHLLVGNYPAVFASLRSNMGSPAATAVVGAPDSASLKKIIGNKSVDVVNYRQLDVINAGFNYRPRPIIQSYVAYTPSLQDINLQHYYGKNRPEFVMLSMETIDGRFPTLDDAPLLFEILYNYHLVSRQGDFLVFKDSGLRLPMQRQLLFEKTIFEGETIDLQPFNSRPLLAEIDFPKTTGWMLSNLVYAPPLMGILVVSGNKEKLYRLPSNMTRKGFILNPLLCNNEAVENFVRNSDPITLDKMKIVRFNGEKKHSLGKLIIRIYSLENMRQKL